MSKIILYPEASTGVTTNTNQHAFYIDDITGLPAVKHGSQVITFGTSGYAFAGSSGSSGQNGTSGLSGTNGISGTSGQDGAPGVNGTNGEAGAAGTSGSSGLSFGTSGTSGETGTSGSSGISGSSGSSASSGSSGTTGSNGTSGLSGTSGVAGVAGTSGTSSSGGLSLNDFWSQMIDDVVPHPGDAFSLIPYSIRITSDSTYKAVVQIVNSSNTVLKTVYTGTTAPNPPTVPTTGLLSWYKADVGISSSGGLITSWADQGLNNVPLLSPSGKEPNYGSTTLNGIIIPDTITGFSDKYMATSGSITLPGETGTIFIVGAQYSGDGTYGQFVQAGFTSGFIVARDTNFNAILGAFGQDTSPYGSIVPATNATFYTIRTISDGTTSLVTLNGTITGSTFTDTSSIISDGLSIFGRASGNYGKKAIAEILIYDYNLSSGDIAIVETYLKNKWGHY